jgi:hypothetical protein
MFNIENMLQQVTQGNSDPQTIEDAAHEHVDSLGANELSGHLHTAASNMTETGEMGLAKQLEEMIQRRQSDPEALKDDAVSFIRSNPQYARAPLRRWNRKHVYRTHYSGPRRRRGARPKAPGSRESPRCDDAPDS